MRIELPSSWWQEIIESAVSLATTNTTTFHEPTPEASVHPLSSFVCHTVPAQPNLSFSL